MNSERLTIAQIGRTVGLQGDLKLHSFTDFPEQFAPGNRFESSRGVLEIERYDPRRSLVRFVGYQSPEEARRLTNAKLYTTREETRSRCRLEKGEYFWFDLLDAELYEGESRLGRVREIQRLHDTDYFVIDTDSELIALGLPRSFLLPYIPRYIVSVDPQRHIIHARDAREILEAS